MTHSRLSRAIFGNSWNSDSFVIWFPLLCLLKDCYAAKPEHFAVPPSIDGLDIFAVSIHILIGVCVALHAIPSGRKKDGHTIVG
jgi:hypothetical protein